MRNFHWTNIQLYIPPTIPKLKYINQMFGANILIIKPQNETIEPAIVTARHPYLLVSALAIGPVK